MRDPAEIESLINGERDNASGAIHARIDTFAERCETRGAKTLQIGLDARFGEVLRKVRSGIETAGNNGEIDWLLEDESGLAQALEPLEPVAGHEAVNDCITQIRARMAEDETISLTGIAPLEAGAEKLLESDPDFLAAIFEKAKIESRSNPHAWLESLKGFKTEDLNLSRSQFKPSAFALDLSLIAATFRDDQSKAQAKHCLEQLARTTKLVVPFPAELGALAGEISRMPGIKLVRYAPNAPFDPQKHGISGSDSITIVSKGTPVKFDSNDAGEEKILSITSTVVSVSKLNLSDLLLLLDKIPPSWLAQNGPSFAAKGILNIDGILTGFVALLNTLAETQAARQTFSKAA